MPISILKYFIKTVEGFSPESFKARQTTVRTYIHNERICELLLKIDTEKLQKRFKSEPTSLYFISLELSGLLTVEVASQLIQWLNAGDESPSEKPCDPDESSCDPDDGDHQS
jgi:hypothetical protein